MNVYFDDIANVRYNILKELSKYQESVNRTNLDKINDFALPVFAGLITLLLSKTIEQFLEITNFWRILFNIIIPIVLYILTYKISKLFILCYHKYINILSNQIDSNSSKEKERIAKFDYEVINLLYASFILINGEDDKHNNRNCREILKEYYLMESILYFKKALDRISESLLPTSINIPISRIKVVMKMATNIIYLQRKSPFESLFSDNITSIISEYNYIIKSVNIIYSLNLNIYQELKEDNKTKMYI